MAAAFAELNHFNIGFMRQNWQAMFIKDIGDWKKRGAKPPVSKKTNKNFDLILNKTTEPAEMLRTTSIEMDRVERRIIELLKQLQCLQTEMTRLKPCIDNIRKITPAVKQILEFPKSGVYTAKTTSEIAKKGSIFFYTFLIFIFFFF